MPDDPNVTPDNESLEGSDPEDESLGDGDMSAA
jgi:hypothetical protein